MTPVYVVHPVEMQFPVMSRFIADVTEVATAEPGWAGYELVWIPMKPDNSFRLTDVTSRVGSRLGPVVIFDVAQGHLREQLRARLAKKTIVIVTSGADSTSLWADLDEGKRLFETGEPHLPRKLVVAILLLRKLIDHQYWGGANEKNFLWADELAKGRGVDESFRDVVAEVANLLLLKGLLIPKYGGNKPSKKKQKYALNHHRRRDIMDLANTRECRDEQLMMILERDRRLTSARVLDDWSESLPDWQEERTSRREKFLPSR